jgi:hypothetical protein
MRMYLRYVSVLLKYYLVEVSQGLVGVSQGRSAPRNDEQKN